MPLSPAVARNYLGHRMFGEACLGLPVRAPPGTAQLCSALPCPVRRAGASSPWRGGAGRRAFACRTSRTLTPHRTAVVTAGLLGVLQAA